MQADQLDAAEHVQCPHLVIEAEDGAKFCPELWYKVLDMYRNNHRFQHVMVPGTHHVHLDDPVVVAQIIHKWWDAQILRPKL